MRIRIEIDEQLVREAMAVAGVKTKREVIEAGLRLLVEVHNQSSIRSLRGRVEWIGDLHANRSD